MTDTSPGGTSPTPPQPDQAMRALSRLVGSWQMTGDATGTITYEWLPGGFFLVQRGELELFGHRNVFTEVIGREKRFGEPPGADIVSRVYTAEGDTLDYVYELTRDTLTIWGGVRGSDSYYTGIFSADGDSLTGAWCWPGGGYSTTATRQPDWAG
jgi:hypothetical protein